MGMASLSKVAQCAEQLIWSDLLALFMTFVLLLSLQLWIVIQIEENLKYDKYSYFSSHSLDKDGAIVKQYQSFELLTSRE